MSQLPGPPVVVRLVALVGGVFASASALVIHKASALPLSLALELAKWIGPEVVMPWVIAIGLVVLGWVPVFVPRSGWLIAFAVAALGVLALLYAGFGGALLGSFGAFAAAWLFVVSANMTRRARRAAKREAKTAAA